MERLIEAEAFLKRNEHFADCEFEHPKYQATLREIVEDEPTVDAVPVVRCGECKCWSKDELVTCGDCKMGIEENGEKYCCGEFHKLDWFCADGERKERTE